MNNDEGGPGGGGIEQGLRNKKRERPSYPVLYIVLNSGC